VRPEVDEEKQNEDRGRSQRDGLQKAEKKFTESHSSIMSARVGGDDVTTRVDLTCRQDGWGGKPRALNAGGIPRYSGLRLFLVRLLILVLAAF